MITLVLGGARSGKSSFAERLAYKQGKDEVIYIATAEAEDGEMKDRIKQHRKDRPSSWRTIEESYQVGEEISSLPANKVILLDCITLLISNWLLKGNKSDGEKNRPGDTNRSEESKNNKESKGGQGQKIKNHAQNEDQIMDKMKEIVVAASDKDLIIVSNEVGLGLVPSYKLGREYRDIAGRVNQYLASQADKVYFSIAGLQVDIKDLAVDL